METFSRETSDLSNTSPWYITGLIEGEGSFTFSRCGRNNVMPYFSVKLTGKDRALLELIQEFFCGIGYIYFVKAHKQIKGGYTKSAYLYRVTKNQDLIKIINHLEQYPIRGTKSQSFQIWREIVILKSVPKITPIDQLNTLAKQLSAASPRNQIWDGIKETA